MDFFLFFLIPTTYQTMHCQSKLKIWYVLFWSYYVTGRLDLNRTIKGCLQDAVCRLGSANTRKNNAKRTVAVSWKDDGSFCTKGKSRLFCKKFIYTRPAVFLFDWLASCDHAIKNFTCRTTCWNYFRKISLKILKTWMFLLKICSRKKRKLKLYTSRLICCFNNAFCNRLMGSNNN